MNFPAALCTSSCGSSRLGPGLDRVAIELKSFVLAKTVYYTQFSVSCDRLSTSRESKRSLLTTFSRRDSTTSIRLPLGFKSRCVPVLFHRPGSSVVGNHAGSWSSGRLGQVKLYSGLGMVCSPSGALTVISGHVVAGGRFESVAQSQYGIRNELAAIR